MVMRFPKSSFNREMACHIRLLTKVHENIDRRELFEGRVFAPGSAAPADLPDPAVLLEYAGYPRGGAPRGTGQWILWRLNRERGEWEEVMRAQSLDRSYREAIHPVARRELYGDIAPPQPQVTEIAKRILRVLDDELRDLPKPAQLELLFALDPELTGRIAQVGNFCELQAAVRV